MLQIEAGIALREEDQVDSFVDPEEARRFEHHCIANDANRDVTEDVATSQDRAQRRIGWEAGILSANFTKPQ